MMNIWAYRLDMFLHALTDHPYWFGVATPFFVWGVIKLFIPSSKRQEKQK